MIKDPENLDKETREKIFKSRATAAGFSPEDIKFAIEKRRAQANIGTKIAYYAGKAAPAIFGTAGAVGGGMLGTVPGAALGGFAGVGAGGAVEDMLLKAAGIRTDTPEEAGKRVKDVSINAGVAGATNAAFMGLSKALKFLKSPTKNIGSALETSRAGTNVATETTEQALKDSLTKDRRYIMSDAKTQKATLNKLLELINKTSEMQGSTSAVQQPQLNLNDLYKNLGAMKGNTPENIYNVLKGSRTSPGVVTDVLNPLQTKGTQRLSSLFSTSKSMGRYGEQAKMSLARSLPWILGGGYLAGKIKETLGGNN